MKVFRTRKYIESCIRFGHIQFIEKQLLEGNWCKELEGKTPEEIEELGYKYSENWLEEE